MDGDDVTRYRCRRMIGPAFTAFAEPRTRAPGHDPDSPWAGVMRLLSACSAEGALLHGLGPLMAASLRERSLPVPGVLETEEQRAAFGMLTVVPLLERVREACEGPLVLMKGAEVAVRYPGAARAIGDIDLLVADARTVHKQLRAAGFVEIGEPELFYGIHHLRPLKWPTLPLAIEIHKAPKWPKRIPAPRVSEIFDAAVPVSLHVDDVLAPAPEHHMLLVAAHAWAHQPLLRLRDLVDIRALAPSADAAAVEATARRWGLLRLWRTTDAAAETILGHGRTTLAVRLWARHLAELRERTVLENHLQEWLAGFWSLPLTPALATTWSAFLGDVRPAPEEGWRDKIGRAVKASRNAVTPLSQHDRLLGDAARRGQGRNPPDEDDL